MAQWEYKTLTYTFERKFFNSLRYWADSSGRAYGPRELERNFGGVAYQMRQLELALKELDQDGWELFSASVWTSWPYTQHGTAILRRPPRKVPENSP
jgi:hypothetical protein